MMMQTKNLTRPFELKSIEPDGTFTGYGSVFGVVDSYSDAVMPGAFLKSLATNGLPAMLWMHQTDQPIGKWLELKEDDHGLLVKGKLLIEDDPLAKRAYGHLKNGSLSGLSIGYSVPKGGGAWDDVSKVYRLTEIHLMEISVVTFPANDQARVGTVKSFDTKRDLESFLRDGGMSQNAAKQLIAGGFAGLVDHRDGEKSDLAELCKNLSGLAAQFKI